MLRVALFLMVACDAGAPPSVATNAIAVKPIPPVVNVVKKTELPTIASTVTTELPAHALAMLTGCWRDASETWTFRRDGKHGLVVVREVGDATYAARARIPRPVSYDSKSETFGFGAAGRIHGLMMVFAIEHDTLDNVVYTSHELGSYTSTGNTSKLKRC